MNREIRALGRSRDVYHCSFAHTQSIPFKLYHTSQSDHNCITSSTKYWQSNSCVAFWKANLMWCTFRILSKKIYSTEKQQFTQSPPYKTKKWGQMTPVLAELNWLAVSLRPDCRACETLKMTKDWPRMWTPCCFMCPHIHSDLLLWLWHTFRTKIGHLIFNSAPNPWHFMTISKYKRSFSALFKMNYTVFN